MTSPEVKYLAKNEKPNLAAIFSQLDLPWGQAVILVFDDHANTYTRLGQSAYQVEDVPLTQLPDLLAHRPE